MAQTYLLNVNDSVVGFNTIQHSRLVLGLLGGSRSSRLASGAGHLLLHQQVEDLGNVLVKEVGISDELLELKDTVQEATGNLTSHLSVNVLDGEVNSVTNEFNFIGTVGDSIELGKVNFGEANLLHSGLLLGSRSLLSSHGGESRLVVDDGLLGGLSSALSLTVVVVVLVSTSTSSLTSSVVLLLAATSSATLVVTSSVVTILSLSLVSHVSSVLLHSVNSLHHVLLLRSLVLRVSEPVEHLSLFASVLLVLKFLLGYPEVNTDGLVAERSALVKTLDSVLSMVNVFVKDKSLLVG